MPDLYLVDFTEAVPTAAGASAPTPPEEADWCACCGLNPTLPGRDYCPGCRPRVAEDERVREVFAQHNNTIVLILSVAVLLLFALLLGFNVGLNEGESRGAAAATEYGGP